MKKSIKNALLTTAGAASVLAGVSVAANASTVKSIKGDTVWNFAQKNHTTVDAIVQANHLSNANLIYVGQSLVIPDATTLANTTTTNSSNNTSTTNTTSQASTDKTATSSSISGDYTVKSGDTLYAISAKSGISVSDLASKNNIANINVLMVGQVLHTTTGSAASTSAASQASQTSTTSQASQASQASAASQAPVASQALSQAPTSVASQAASQAPASVASQAPASEASEATSTAAPASQAPVSQASQAPATNTDDTTNTNTPSSSASSVSGDYAQAGINGFNTGVNGYPAGQCTAFVAGILQARGISSSEWAYLGNGNAWGASAANRGLSVSTTPTAGSVAYFGYMHVAYVTSVNGNGTVNIIEGNFEGLAYHARTISASEAAGYIVF
ncbi:LysM peptidoglycan-binding domain-containing protein [Furfurilactobacillus sp. WILCCON 0119]